MLVVLNTTACVSSKSFNELDVKYRQLKSDYDALASNNSNEIGEKNKLLSENLDRKEKLILKKKN